MNALTILLTSLASAFSLIGLAPEVAVEQGLRRQLDHVEQLTVRVDATPNHQLLRGQLERLRLAGRGLYPVADVRIDRLDIETDPIDVDLAALRQGRIELDQPFQAAFNLVLTQADIDQALRSPLVIEQLETISIDVLGDTVGQIDQAILTNPNITLLNGDRIQFSATLLDSNTQAELAVELTTGVTVVQGSQIQLIAPQITANGVEFPIDLIEDTLAGLSQQYSLTELAPQGIIARILRLQITDEQLVLTSFIQVVPQPN